jgi:argininosuccinate synthase
VFARDVIVPAVAASMPLDQEALERVAHPVIAAALLEVAAIEGAGAVAHASAQDSLTTLLRGLEPTRRVLAPAREWIARRVDVAEYVKMHHLSPNAPRVERHLLIRRPAATASGCEAASVTVGFEDGIPASVNGVSMGLPELIESLSVIGGRYGLGALEPVPAPAFELLQAAHTASGGRGSVALLVRDGSIAVAGPAAASALRASAPRKAGRDEAGHDDEGRAPLVNYS